MEAVVQEFTRKYSQCADSRSEVMVPRPLAELQHGEASDEVMHIVFLHFRGAEGLGVR